MIKLTRPDKPHQLTSDVEIELIEEFKKTKHAVWRKPYIIESLLLMSHSKCCYCETALETQAKAMQVDHFHFKEGYPNEVVSWENLLPSCSQCNSNKAIIDTYAKPMINPAIDDPKEYLYLKNYMIKSKDNSIGSKGRNTVDELDLNNRDRLVTPRVKISVDMLSKLSDIHEKALSIKNREDGRQYNRKRVLRGMQDVLKMAQPEAEYSAFMATIILTDEDYIETRNILIEKELWNDELESLHIKAKCIKLDTNK